MNVLIDTNIILDDLLNREPRRKQACQIMDLVNDKKIFGYITANTLTDIYYVVERKANEDIARKSIRKILNTLSVISVDADDCTRAIDSLMKDFEDALVAVCAEKAALDFIITNDKDFLGEINLPVSSISSDDFLLRVE